MVPKVMEENVQDLALTPIAPTLIWLWSDGTGRIHVFPDPGPCKSDSEGVAWAARDNYTYDIKFNNPYPFNSDHFNKVGKSGQPSGRPKPGIPHKSYKYDVTCIETGAVLDPTIKIDP